jgi:acid phosphatase class B
LKSKLLFVAVLICCSPLTVIAGDGIVAKTPAVIAKPVFQAPPAVVVASMQQQAPPKDAREPLVITLDVPDPVYVDSDGMVALRTAVSDLQSATKEISALRQAYAEKSKQASSTIEAAKQLVEILSARGESVKLRGVGDAVLFNLNDDAIIRVPFGYEQQIEAAVAKIPRKTILKGDPYTFIVCNRKYFTVSTGAK